MKSRGWTKVKTDITTLVSLRTLQLKQKITDIRRSRIVVESAEGEEVPFHLQGRLSLNTEEMIERRMALRRHPGLVHVLEVWWETAQQEQSESRRPNGYIGKAQYMTLSRKLYRAMVERWDEADSIAVAEEEWSRDTIDGRMGRELFMDGIFEVRSDALV